MRILTIGLTWVLAVFLTKDVVGQDASMIISQSALPTSVESDSEEETQGVSNVLEYKPIKPSYQSSGTNIGQIVPPGQPWPANAAGYEQFSQLSPSVSSQTYNLPAAPVLMSPGGTSSTDQIINIDLSNPGIDLVAALQQALSSYLAAAKTITAQQRTISLSLNIVPPPNAGMDFVTSLQSAIKSIVSKADPIAGTSLRITMTKSATGAITNIKALLDITPGTMRQIPPTLPPSTVPEIDLRTSKAGLVPNLQTILLSELNKKGYIAGSDKVQNFQLSFSVLPPEGSTKDFVRMNVLKPLQTTLRHLVPHSAITSVSVNTQESNNKVLRQTVNFSIRVRPTKVPQITENVVNIPEVNIGIPGPNTVSILEQIVGQAASSNPTQSQTLSIPIKIAPPAGASKEQIQVNYIRPLQEMLAKVNPDGKILKWSLNTQPNGQVIFTVYLYVPASGVNPTNVPQITGNLVNIPEVNVGIPGPNTASTLEKIIGQATISNPSLAKTLSIPFKIVPPAGATKEQIEVNYIRPLQEMLAKVNPDGQVRKWTLNTQPNGDIIYTVYLYVPAGGVNVKPIPSGNIVNIPALDVGIPGPNTASVLQQIIGQAATLNPTQPKTLSIPFKFKPPVGETKDQIEENYIRPLQEILSQVNPDGQIMKWALKTEPNGEVIYAVDLYVPANGINVEPTNVPEPSGNAINVPTLDVGVPGSNTASVLKQIIVQATATNPTQPKTLSIPFKIVPPVGATKDQVEETYIRPLQEILANVNPDGNIMKWALKTEPNGDIIYTVDLNVPASGLPEKNLNPLISNIVTEKEVPSSTTLPPIPVMTTTTTVRPSTIVNHNKVQNDEEPIPTARPQNETPSPIQNEITKNAVITPAVDLTKPDTSISELQNILNTELSPVTNPNDNGPKTLAIPIISKPPVGVTPQNMEETIIQPIRKVLKEIEPTGSVVASKVQVLPNGNIGSLVYFNVPSVKASKTYKDLSAQLQPVYPAKPSTLAPTSPTPTSLPGISQPSKVQIPTNAVETIPIDISNPNLPLDLLKNEIDKGLQQVLKPNKENPSKNTQPKTIGLPFIIPTSQTNQIPNLAQNAASLVKKLEPTAQVLPSIVPKVLPNGETQFVVYFLVPSVEDTNTFKEIEQPSRPIPSTLKPSTPSPVVVTEISQPQQDQVPTNAVETTPVVISNPNVTPDLLKNQISKGLQEVLKPNRENPSENAQPKTVGLPFIIPSSQINQIPNIAQNAASLVKKLEPTAQVLPSIVPKVLPNGETQFVVYFLVPSVEDTNTFKEIEQPSRPIPSTLKPSTPSHVVVTEISQPQQDQVPTNAVETTPVVISNPNVTPDLLKNQISKGLQEALKPNRENPSENVQPKTVGLPFIIPSSQINQIPIIAQNAASLLKKLEPTAQILPNIVPKTLPNGETQFIIYFNVPSVDNTNTFREIEQVTNPNESELPQGQTEKPQQEPIPINAVKTTPIDISTTTLTPALLQNEIQKGLQQVLKPNKENPLENAQPKTIGLPFIIPRGQVNQIPNIAQNAASLLKKLEPTAQITPNIVPKVLPNGEIEFIIYFDVPSVEDTNTFKEIEQVINPNKSKLIEGQTETPQTQQIPTNAVETVPIDISTPTLIPSLLQNEIQKGLQQIRIPNSEGQSVLPKTIGLPFTIPRSQLNQIPSIAQNIYSVLKGIKPTAQILPVLVPKTLPNGNIQFVIYFQLPSEEDTNVEQGESVLSNQDINLDVPGKTVAGEVGKALVRALVDNAKNPEIKDESELINFNCYLPEGATPSEIKKAVADISQTLKKLEPTGQLISANLNENGQKDQPDAVLKYLVPSISNSKTVQVANQGITLPTIDLNHENGNLAQQVKYQILNGLKTLNPSTATGQQLFNLNFQLNPYDEKGSINAILNALKIVDPKGQTVSYKIRTAPDGLEYLDVIYLIPNLQDSILYQTIHVHHEPEIVYQAVTNIDARNPMNMLLEKVIGLVGKAVDYVKGAQPEQIIDLPLNFRITNSQGMSDAQVSQIVSRLLPYLERYINQVLPVGKIISAETQDVPNSDDVVLKIIDRTPYEPDNVIVIQDVRRS